MEKTLRIISIVLLLCGAVFAQNAVVVPLDADDAKKAHALAVALDQAQTAVDEFKRVVEYKYTFDPSGPPPANDVTFGTSSGISSGNLSVGRGGSVFYCAQDGSCNGGGGTPKIKYAERKQEFPDSFDYSRDYKFIVPHKTEYHASPYYGFGGMQMPVQPTSSPYCAPSSPCWTN